MKPLRGTIEVRLDMATRMSISAKEPKLTLETYTISVHTPLTPSLNQVLTSTSGLGSLLSNLLYAKDALFNLYIKQHDPTCLENTCVDVLRQIQEWANKQDKQYIF